MQVLEVPAVQLETRDGFESAVFAYTTDIPLLTNWGTPLLLGPGSIHVATPITSTSRWTNSSLRWTSTSSWRPSFWLSSTSRSCCFRQRPFSAPGGRLTPKEARCAVRRLGLAAERFRLPDRPMVLH